MNDELPDVQAGFRKGRGTRDQIANIRWIIERAREFQKTSISALSTMPKPLTLLISANWKILKEIGTSDHLTCLLRICMQVKKQQLELDMKQQTVCKSGKEYVKSVYCHPAYSTYMPITSCEMPGWMKHKLESRFLGEISITSDTQMTPTLWQKAKNYRAS